MPSTVADIFAAAGASRNGVVPWSTPLPARGPERPSTGLYVVALSSDPVDVGGALADAPIDDKAVGALLAARPELRLDGSRPTRKELAARLGKFWLADEVVLYIGLAGPRRPVPANGEVARRVGEYYKTRLGARSPHAGGWPLKTLSCLQGLHVHFGYCDDVVTAENHAIGHFAYRISADTRAQLHDSIRVMPFANIEFPKGTRKKHGITGAREPRRRRAS